MDHRAVRDAGHQQRQEQRGDQKLPEPPERDLPYSVRAISEGQTEAVCLRWNDEQDQLPAQRQDRKPKVPADRLQGKRSRGLHFGQRGRVKSLYPPDVGRGHGDLEIRQGEAEALSGDDSRGPAETEAVHAGRRGLRPDTRVHAGILRRYGLLQATVQGSIAQ